MRVYPVISLFFTAAAQVSAASNTNQNHEGVLLTGKWPEIVVTGNKVLTQTGRQSVTLEGDFPEVTLKGGSPETTLVTRLPTVRMGVKMDVTETGKPTVTFEGGKSITFLFKPSSTASAEHIPVPENRKRLEL